MLVVCCEFPKGLLLLPGGLLLIHDGLPLIPGGLLLIPGGLHLFISKLFQDCTMQPLHGTILQLRIYTCTFGKYVIQIGLQHSACLVGQFFRPPDWYSPEWPSFAPFMQSTDRWANFSPFFSTHFL